MKGAAMQGGMENPHVGFTKIIAELIGFLLLTPLMILVLTSVVLPVVTGMGGADVTDSYMNFLYRAQAFERWCAVYSAPEVKFGKTVLLEEAWNYQTGVKAAKAIVPGDRQGFFMDDTMADKTRGGQESVNREVDRAGERGDNKVMTGINAKAHSWVQDRFYPVMGVTITIAVARGFLWLEMLMIAFLALPALWFFGGYLARRRDELAIQPLGHRYKWYIQGAMWFFATSVAVVFLPVPLPAAIVLPVLFMIIGLLVALARGHAVVNL